MFVCKLKTTKHFNAAVNKTTWHCVQAAKLGAASSLGEPQTASHSGHRDNAETSVAAFQSTAAVPGNITTM